MLAWVKSCFQCKNSQRDKVVLRCKFIHRMLCTAVDRVWNLRRRFPRSIQKYSTMKKMSVLKARWTFKTRSNWLAFIAADHSAQRAFAAINSGKSQKSIFLKMQDAKSHEGRSPQAVTCGWGVQEQAANAGQRFNRLVCRSEASLCVPLCGCCVASKPYPPVVPAQAHQGAVAWPRLRAFVRTRMLSRRGWIEGGICTDVVYRAAIVWVAYRQATGGAWRTAQTDGWMGCVKEWAKKGKKKAFSNTP